MESGLCRRRGAGCAGGHDQRPGIEPDGHHQQGTGHGRPPCARAAFGPGRGQGRAEVHHGHDPQVVGRGHGRVQHADNRQAREPPPQARLGLRCAVDVQGAAEQPAASPRSRPAAARPPG